MYPLAVIGSLIVGAILLVFINAKASECDYILVVECKDEASEKAVGEIINAGVKKCAVKSKTVTAGYIEATYEIRLSASSTEFVNKVSAAQGIEKAVLVSYNGDYMA